MGDRKVSIFSINLKRTVNWNIYRNRKNWHGSQTYYIQLKQYYRQEDDDEEEGERCDDDDNIEEKEEQKNSKKRRRKKKKRKKRRRTNNEEKNEERRKKKERRTKNNLLLLRIRGVVLILNVIKNAPGNFDGVSSLYYQYVFIVIFFD